MKRLFSIPRIITFIESTRPSDRWLLRGALALVLLIAAWFILSLNNAVQVTDIRAGGELREGILGTPRFVNPVLALTRADQDVTQLVYSGLISVDQIGELTPDLAESWTVSADGTIYTVSLRQDATFHDDIPVTAADVLYTIELIQNSDLKSPLRANWTSVTASAINDYTIELTLTEAYAPFIENLTVGILPAHIWRSIPIEQIPFTTQNTTPVGSGPYKIETADFSRSGTVETYELQAVTDHYSNPLLETIELKFYSTEEDLVTAFTGNDIDSTAYLPAELVRQIDPEFYTISESPLTRTFALFFNQNKSTVLRDAAVREALELLIDRDIAIADALNGAGIPSPTIVANYTDEVEFTDGETHLLSDATTEARTDIARLVLTEAGWSETEDGAWVNVTDDGIIPLRVTIRTANTELFDRTADTVARMWRQFGIEVTTEQFTQANLVENVIRDRDFEILLFGADPGRTNDLYPFWHSSQQDDPGLNIAQYTNLTVDEFLDELRLTTDITRRDLALQSINTIISDERPAVALFQPTLQYVSPINVTALPPQTLTHPSDRFTTIASWYTDHGMLWPIFTGRADPADEPETLNTAQNQN